MYSTAKPTSRTTEAAADRVKKRGSISGLRRRAIAIERVRWPRPVPFEVTNRIRSRPLIGPPRGPRAHSSEALIGLDQRSCGVVSLPLELRQRPPVAARERPAGRAAGALAPAAAAYLLGHEPALEERAHAGVVVKGEQLEQRPVRRLALAGGELVEDDDPEAPGGGRGTARSRPRGGGERRFRPDPPRPRQSRSTTVRGARGRSRRARCGHRGGRACRDLRCESAPRSAAPPAADGRPRAAQRAPSR